MISEEHLQQLEAQAALQTDCLVRMLQGQWVGFPSLQADLDGLNPTLELTPRPPLLTSEVSAPINGPAWLEHFNANREWPMEPQQRDWTCSVCSTTWVLQATAIDPNASRYDVAVMLGYPGCVNEEHGLETTDCIIKVFGQYGIRARQEWVNFEAAWTLARTATILNGLGWYHFIGLRGALDSDTLAIANSAEGYRGVYSTLSRSQFNSLGPFQAVYLDPSVE